VPREDGQATVELLGAVPALLAVGLLVWQLILVGHTAWLSAHAARAAARAALVGEDAAAAAKSALPDGLEKGLEVESDGGGTTHVRVPIPIVHHGWHAPLTVGAHASLEAAQ
jgi:pilus assembly protein CpaE